MIAATTSSIAVDSSHASALSSFTTILIIESVNTEEQATTAEPATAFLVAATTSSVVVSSSYALASSSFTKMRTLVPQVPLHTLPLTSYSMLFNLLIDTHKRDEI